MIEHKGAATTPLGYDDQYSDSDTGLIYLRARYYDPTTGQLLTTDPEVATTGARYVYAADDPVANADPTGLNYVYWLTVAQAGELAEAVQNGGAGLGVVLGLFGPVGDALGALGGSYLELYVAPKLEVALTGAEAKNAQNAARNRRHARRKQAPNKQPPWGVTISVHTVLGGHHHDVPNGVVGAYTRQRGDAPGV